MNAEIVLQPVVWFRTIQIPMRSWRGSPLRPPPSSCARFLFRAKQPFTFGRGNDCFLVELLAWEVVNPDALVANITLDVARAGKQSNWVRSIRLGRLLLGTPVPRWLKLTLPDPALCQPSFILVARVRAARITRPQIAWQTPDEFASTFTPRRSLALRYANGSAPAPVAPHAQQGKTTAGNEPRNG